MIKVFFQYTIHEQRGVALLTVVLCIALGVRFWPLPEVDYDVSLIYAEQDTSSPSPGYINRPSYQLKNKPVRWQLELFDLNYAKAKDLRMMGFQNAFISNWFSAKQKVGFVKSYKEFEALKLLSTSDLNRVKPFLDFSRYERQSKTITNRAIKIIPILNLNLADSTELKLLPGIGNSYSKRIVKYREKLGGFYAIDQLLEVYGVDTPLFNNIQLYLQLDSFTRKLNLNLSEVNDLQTHPYISYKQAKAIVQYRNQHGPFMAFEDVLRIYVLDEKWLRKTRPYLILH